METDMNILIDPDVAGDDLRRQLYAGSLVILTRLQALADPQGPYGGEF